jgi:hypothetical protein
VTVLLDDGDIDGVTVGVLDDVDVPLSEGVGVRVVVNVLVRDPVNV